MQIDEWKVCLSRVLIPCHGKFEGVMQKQISNLRRRRKVWNKIPLEAWLVRKVVKNTVTYFICSIHQKQVGIKNDYWLVPYLTFAFFEKDWIAVKKLIKMALISLYRSRSTTNFGRMIRMIACRKVQGGPKIMVQSCFIGLDHYFCSTLYIVLPVS